MVRRWIPALVLGGLWWWAVLRLVFRPEQAGAVEGAVAAGGWGLSLLPVHVASVGVVVGRPRAGERASRARTGRYTAGAWRGRLAAGPSRLAAGVTRAWRRRRSGGGSGRW
ncbi:hypothetical protein AB0387_17945 [Streptomyces sp. NPDC089173]|uniref:hypothetical protein n=1 Tax=Streptomyces sp. NPDC089173 TaxID=3154965 RepID=UPI00344C9021